MNRSEFPLTTVPKKRGQLPEPAAFRKLSTQHPPLSTFERFVKRALDVSLSLLGVLFILSWLFPLLSLLVWLDGGSPVLFVQKRIGKDGRLFHCFKFRTMAAHSGPGVQQITALGRYLRRSRLDEIPQLFNVLAGQMSLVGPRPHMVSDHMEFSQVIGQVYHRRHDVRPGITGLAQVRGYEGEIDSMGKLRGRVRLDLFYLNNWSPALDVWILWETLAYVWRGSRRDAFW